MLAESIEPLVQKKMTQPLIAKEPKPGKIKKVEFDEITGARKLTLSNGAIVYTKKTDFKDDEIMFYAQSFGGTSLYDVSEERNIRFLDYVMSNVGLGVYSATDLRKYLAGHNVWAAPRVSLIEDEMDGNSVKKDLPYLFQLIYCYFCNPGSSLEDFQIIQQRLHQSLETSSLDPRNQFSDTLNALRYNHNPRVMKPTLEDIDKMDFARIQAIYKETSELGFVINLSTTEGYTKEPIDFTVAVGNDGKVAGMTVTAYPDTKEVGDDFIASFTGQDSALADVALVSGATFSSSAIKNAVSDGLNYLIDGGFIAAGVKGDDQVLMELLPTVCSGMANSSGVAQFEEAAGASGNIVSAMRALNVICVNLQMWLCIHLGLLGQH